MGEAQETETEYDTGWGSQGAGPWVSQLVQDNSLADRNPQSFSSWPQEAISCVPQQSPQSQLLDSRHGFDNPLVKKNRGQLRHPSSTKTGSRHGHGNRAEAAT